MSRFGFDYRLSILSGTVMEEPGRQVLNVIASFPLRRGPLVIDLLPNIPGACKNSKIALRYDVRPILIAVVP